MGGVPRVTVSALYLVWRSSRAFVRASFLRIVCMLSVRRSSRMSPVISSFVRKERRRVETCLGFGFVRCGDGAGVIGLHGDDGDGLAAKVRVFILLDAREVAVEVEE